MARKQSAAEQRVEQWVEHRRQHEEEDRRQRAMVIAEFDAGDPEATAHALANEILRYREALRLLAKAIGWAQAGAPFGLISLSSLASEARARNARRPAGGGAGFGHGAQSGRP